MQRMPSDASDTSALEWEKTPTPSVDTIGSVAAVSSSSSTDDDSGKLKRNLSTSLRVDLSGVWEREVDTTTGEVQVKCGVYTMCIHIVSYVVVLVIALITHLYVICRHASRHDYSDIYSSHYHHGSSLFLCRQDRGIHIV